MSSRGAPTMPRALVRLMLAVEDAYASASRDTGVTAQQAQLLCLARRPAAIGELADAMRCDRSNISRMVDRAAGRGLVRRRPDERDGRVAVVELTRSGQEVMERFVETLDDRLERLMRGWSAARRRAALDLLNDVAAAVEAVEEPLPPAQAEPALRPF